MTDLPSSDLCNLSLLHKLGCIELETGKLFQISFQISFQPKIPYPLESVAAYEGRASKSQEVDFIVFNRTC